MLLCEGAIRILNPQFLRTAIRESVDGVIALRPNLRARYYSPGEYDARATTNSQRFRSHREYSRIIPPGTKRIVAIGDSFTFGTGVSDNETYPAKLEALLNRSGNQLTVEVLNSGIHGTGTGNQVLWYDRWVRQFDPDLVILALFANDLNDVAKDTRFVLGADGLATPMSQERLLDLGRDYSLLRSLALKIPGYDFLCQHSHLVNLARSTATARLKRQRQRKLSATQADTQPDNQEETIDLLVAEIRWLQKRIAEDGTELVVAYIPKRESFEERYQSTPRVRNARILIERLESENRSNGLAFLRLDGAIREYMNATGRSPYFERDFHFRADGNNLVAIAIFQYLAENSALRFWIGETSHNH